MGKGSLEAVDSKGVKYACQGLDTPNVRFRLEELSNWVKCFVFYHLYIFLEEEVKPLKKKSASTPGMGRGYFFESFRKSHRINELPSIGGTKLVRNHDIGAT